MSLREYRNKRDFSRTPEPDGDQQVAPRRRYAMQKHAARRLHYDLRLELDGVLLSWAVPKGPSLDPREKRLAVQTEDHPLDYAGFEGVIPEGEYGAGSVMLWDQGEWEPITDPHQAEQEGMYKIRLFGRKLRGAWALVKIKSEDGERTWLLIKERDDEVRAEEDYCITDQEPFSVATNRTMREIAAARDRIWSSSTGLVSGRQGRWVRRDAALRTEQLLDLGDLPDARPATQPSRFKPALPRPAEDPPDGADWVHEIAVDGQPMIAVVRPDEVRLLTDDGEDWTDDLPELARAVGRLPVDEAILDGTIAVFDARGVAHAAALDAALTARRSAIVRYEVHDLPFCRGHDLRRVPLLDRKDVLDRLIAAGDAGDLLRFARHLAAPGPVVYEQACRLGVPALVSRKAGGRYAARGAAVTTACRRILPLLICGQRTQRKRREVALAYFDSGDDLQLADVLTLPAGADDDVVAELDALPEADCPLETPPPGRGWRWHAPTLVVDVAVREWDADTGLHGAVLLGVSADDPEAATHAPQTGDERTAEQAAAAERVARAPAQVLELHGVRFTNPERMLYPEDRVTKRTLAGYYEAVAEQMLPHIARRPLSLYRCPNGYENESFFQKHLGEMQTPHLRESPVRRQEGKDPYIALDDIAGLMTLAQLSVLEVHPWGSREDDIDKPDRMIFDLDPGPDVPWRQVVLGARLLRDHLADLGLTSFVKTSGGKGLHVVVPLQRRSTWKQVKGASMAIARRVAEAEPKQFVITMARWARNRRVFIDYLRNVRGATCVAAFSTRARAGAAVSAPLYWDELDANPVVYTVHSLPRRLSTLRGDPWDGFLTVRQSLTRKILKQLQVRPDP